jgi:hypothetical protein
VLPDEELLDWFEVAVLPVPVDVEEWPGKAWLTYAAKAATAATDPMAIPLVIERERRSAPSRRRAARAGSVGVDREEAEAPCPASREDMSRRYGRKLTPT